MVLVGVQPVLIQVPPAYLRSIIAVFFPAAVRTSARGLPPWPEPMMMASKSPVLLASALMCDLRVKHYDDSTAQGGPRFLQVGDQQKAATDRDQVFDQGQQHIGGYGA